MTIPQADKEKIRQTARSFFQSKKWKDLPIFLVFVVVASAFRLMQYFQETKNSELEASASTGNPHTESVLYPDPLQAEGKEVPIRIDGTISPAAGYRFDSLHVEPSTVWASGDKAVLDTLQWIATVTVKEEKIRENIHLTVKLQVPKGIHASVQKVKIGANLEKYAEKKFELPVICSNSPEDIRVRFFPSTIAVVCYLSLNDYSSLKAEDLTIGVDYKELLRNTGPNVPLVMLRKPPGLSDYRLSPETVEYLIEQKKSL
jgi:hypothetical protein